MSEMIVQKWNDEISSQALDFLYQHKETSLFLLDNFRRCGADLGKELYSGNFKVISEDNKICAVFCLTQAGNLLLQSDGAQDYSELVYKSCLEENGPTAGAIGDWQDAILFWHYVQKANPNVSPKNLSKEKLYALELSETSGTKQDGVRFLKEDDFEVWHRLDQLYRKEIKLPAHGTTDQKRQQFRERTQQKHWWGFGNTAVGCFNACVEGVAQVGGMYTDHNHRKKGQAKKVLETMLWDAYHQHDIHTLILFTGQDNIPAQSLYEGAGFRHIGYFGLLFWAF